MFKKAAADNFMNKRGATLVELTVTIGIVSVLAGLLLSGVQAVRNSAEYVEHLNWLRQRRLDDPPHRKNLRVVFIGNSLTYYQDMPGIVVEFAKTIGTTIKAKVVVQGAQTLEGHWNDNFNAQNAITSEWNDFIVLQERGMRPYYEPDLYQEYASKFCDLTNNDAITLMFVNWEQQIAYQDTVTNQSVVAIQKQENKGSEICAIGEAWKIASIERSDINLYIDDRHPNENGAYLTACFIHSVLHRVSPVGLPNSVVTQNGTSISIDPEYANYLQNVAWKTAEKFRKKYKPYYLK
jgi:type II secretory pathway pseudopilin PulG